MRFTPAVLAVLLLATPAARAQDAAPAPAQEAPASPPQEAPTEESLDFDLLEPAPAADVAQVVDPALERAIQRRRTMLRVHQTVGLGMAAGLATTVVLGQLQFNDSFVGGEDNRKLLPWHRGFVIGTSALFLTGATLGLLAPTPYPQESRWDTVRFHKLFMTIATVGMLTQAVLGYSARQNYGNVAEVRLATAHQVVGYVTLGAVAAGVVSLSF